jgi:hypothetical protein
MFFSFRYQLTAFPRSGTLSPPVLFFLVVGILSVLREPTGSVWREIEKSEDRSTSHPSPAYSLLSNIFARYFTRDSLPVGISRRGSRV